MDMTWMRHPEVALPSLVTVEAFETLYQPRDWERVDLDLSQATVDLQRSITGPGDLEREDVLRYLAARQAEADEKARAAKSAKPAAKKSDEKSDKED